MCAHLRKPVGYLQASFVHTRSRCTSISSPIRSDMRRITMPRVVCCRCSPGSFAPCWGMDLANTHVILTSDHGNIEDLSVRNHTLNPVPTIVWGRHRTRIAPRIRSLTDITPAIVDVLTKGTETNGELDNTGRAFAQN